MPANGKSKRLPLSFSACKVAPLLCTILCMTIYVNNESRQLADTAVVADVLRSLNIVGQKGMALAVNSTVVPRQEWDNYSLKDNDKIMIIKATQGG
jgi:sulfur carrier protein